VRTDIIVTACGRNKYLRRTLRGILERTDTPHTITLLDDSEKRQGIAANILQALEMAKSDPFVLTDDDVLCPQTVPDWLERELAAMQSHPDLALLALNTPSCNYLSDRRKRQGVDGQVTRCLFVPGHFLMIWHQPLEGCTLDDLAGQSPVKNLCRWIAKEERGGVGYLTETYCWHFGVQSARTDTDISGMCVEPLDMFTLEPIGELRG